MPNKQIVFKVDKKDMLKVSKDINKLMPRSENRAAHILEFDFYDNITEINSIGMIFTINCETIYIGKAMIPYQFFKMMADFSLSPEISVTLSDGVISFDNKSYTSDYIKILDEGNTKKEDAILSLNYSKLELLSLKHKYNNDYLIKRNLLKKVEKDEELLNSAIIKAQISLNDYEVTIKDLKELIQKKMERYLD